MSLYPDWFDDDLMIEEDIEDLPFQNSYEFDFRQGTTKMTMSGKSIPSDAYQAYMFWVWKCLHTERFQYPTYTSDFGVEIREIIAQGYDRSVTESEIKRTITEALEVHRHTKSVQAFEFEWLSDHVKIRFVLESSFDQQEIVFRREV